MFAPSRGGDFLKSAFRAIGGAVVIAAAFKRNTGAVQSRLVSPILNYSHFLNSPCVDQRSLMTRCSGGSFETRSSHG